MKPGRKTSEWWLVVAVIAGNVILAATGSLESQAAQQVDWKVVGLAAVYALARGLAKLGGGIGGGT